MNRQPVVSLTAIHHESKESSCMATLERGLALMQERYRQRLIAHAEMRRAIRESGWKPADEIVRNKPRRSGGGRKAGSVSLSPAEVEHLLRMRLEGYTVRRIAEILGRSKRAVEKRLAAAGIRKGAA